MGYNAIKVQMISVTELRYTFRKPVGLQGRCDLLGSYALPFSACRHKVSAVMLRVHPDKYGLQCNEGADDFCN